MALAENLPLFPTTVVGSWPRPKWLMEAFDDFAEKRLSEKKLTSYMDDAVKIALKDQELAGIDMVSDGEQRRFSFLAVIAEKVAGFELMNIIDLARGRADVLQTIEEMMLPKSVPQPIATRAIRRNRPIALDELKFAKKYTDRPIKVPLPSPYMLSWQAWDSQQSKEAYPSWEDLADDLVKVLRKEIIALRNSGASFVQLDDPTIQNPLNPEKYMKFLTMLLGHKPRSFKEELRWAVQLINETVKGIGGVTLGLHVCRGNWPAPEEILPKGAYGPILPYLLETKVDQLVLEFATSRAGPIDVFKDYPTEKQIGLGVIDVKSREVETPETVTSRVKRALRYFDEDQIYLNPDCGFASGRTWPVADRITAFDKLRNMTEAAKVLRGSAEG